MKVILLTLFLVLPLMVSTKSKVFYLANKDEVRESLVQKINYRDTIVNFIKEHEGIKFNPYICPGGHLTVGAGHIIRDFDNMSYPLNISQIDSLILKDLERSIRMFKMNTPKEVRYKLRESQRWVIIHFIFCKGIGNYNKSTFKKRIIANDSLAYKELHKWCYYTSNGKKIRSNHSYKTRLKEIKLWIESN